VVLVNSSWSLLFNIPFVISSFICSVCVIYLIKIVLVSLSVTSKLLHDWILISNWYLIIMTWQAVGGMTLGVGLDTLNPLPSPSSRRGSRRTSVIDIITQPSLITSSGSKSRSKSPKPSKKVWGKIRKEVVGYFNYNLFNSFIICVYLT